MRVKSGLAEMLKGGVIMDVVNAEQAKIAEDSGAVAVMALERVPADIRRDGGVSRMSDPAMIAEIQEAVTIPVIALILGMVGVPAEGIGLILGVDRFLDMCRTTLNVTGDLAAAVVVSRTERAA